MPNTQHRRITCGAPSPCGCVTWDGARLLRQRMPRPSREPDCSIDKKDGSDCAERSDQHLTPRALSHALIDFSARPWREQHDADGQSSGRGIAVIREILLGLPGLAGSGGLRRR
jgi:hypothetical protein